MSSVNKTLFLIGGYDLEMITIKNLLIDFGYVDITITKDFNQPFCFADKNLRWGAELAEYKDFFNFDGDILGIELTETKDIVLPKNYKPIDHHNDYIDKPTAIEQVLESLTKIPVECQNSLLNIWLPDNSIIKKEAEELGIEPLKYLKIIAANDVGHIKGMRSLFVDEYILQAIRFADRTIQGVTIDEWSLGEKSLNEIDGKKTIKDVVVVKSLSNYFSTITDRLDEEKLIVFNVNSLVYFGLNAHELKNIFNDYIEKKQAFFGGNKENGYFGFTKFAIEKEGSTNLIEMIVNHVSNSSPISHHIFLFSFQWDYKTCAKKELYDEPYISRTDLKKVDEIMKANNIKNTSSENLKYHERWKRYYFDVLQPSDYNEYTYFYNHVREALFDKESEETISKKVLLQYEYIQPYELKYVINIAQRERKDQISYELEVENITLNFYDSGIGIFAFHLTNNKYYDYEDILQINDFGRRIYPQYLSYSANGGILNSVKQSFLADSIQLKSEKENYNICECFNYYNNLSDLKDCKIVLPKYISELLGEKFSSKLKKEQNDMIQIRPVIDDRMFTLCWYGDDKLSNALKYTKRSKIDNNQIYKYESSPIWNKFIFIDNLSPSLASENLLFKQNCEHSNNRWVDYGVLFGISRYSFIALTDTGCFAKKSILKHVQTIYFQLVMLAIVQRASVIRFSIEVTSLSNLESDNNVNKRNLTGDIQNLHKKYIRFVNKVYFREVTAQEQGIELYDMLIDKMRLNIEVKNLDNEIEELYRYVNNLETNEGNKKLEKLNILLAIFIIPSIIFGFFGMNIFEKDALMWHKGIYYPIILVFLSILFYYAGAYLTQFKFKRNYLKYFNFFSLRNNDFNKNIIWFILIVLFIILLIPFFYKFC